MPRFHAARGALPALILALSVSSCRTTDGPSDAGPSLPGQTAAAKIQRRPSAAVAPVGAAGGYFVSIAADTGDAKTVRFYDGLYAAVDKWNRARALEEGRLDSYLEDHEGTGETRLAAGDDEIECDRIKCLLKLRARSLESSAGDRPGLPELLVEALALSGVKGRQAKGTGPSTEKLYALGDDAALTLRCVENRAAKPATFRCDFLLDRVLAASSASAALGEAGRGKLTSCALSPGTARSAEDARAVLDKGGLLPLTASPAPRGKTVGYIRYVRDGARVELLDVYLCGDLSQDQFQVEGEARRPRRWIAEPRARGGKRAGIASVHADDTALELEAELVEETPTAVVLGVSFRVVPTGDAAGEASGADRFFLRMDKSWL